MKKLIIISVLVILVVGGIFGGTALVSSKPAGSGVMMETGGDSVLLQSAGETTLAAVYIDGVAHVSLTAFVEATLNPDTVYVKVGFESKNGQYIAPKTIQLEEGLNTLEFDAMQMHGGSPRFDFCWKLIANNADDDRDIMVSYNYTMTYPR